mgnify:CR=1 FL=1
MLQVFEVCAQWNKADEKMKDASLEVVNQKMFFNVNVEGIETVHQNFDDKGNINGFKIFDEVSSRVLTVKRTLPYKFAFQNEITFCRYQYFYRYTKPYDTPRPQILMVEA